MFNYEYFNPSLNNSAALSARLGSGRMAELVDAPDLGARGVASNLVCLEGKMAERSHLDPAKYLSAWLFKMARFLDALSWWFTVRAEALGEGNEVLR